jgi:hypothetical protein
MVKLQVTCPACFKTGFIEIPDDLIEENTRGVLSINVGDHICNHSFVAYFDNHLDMRDSFLTDFTVELPEMELEKQLKSSDISDLELLGTDLIKLNLYPITLAFILHGCFLKRKMLILSKKDFLLDRIERFFELVFSNSFRVDIGFASKEDYESNKKKYSDCIVLEGINVKKDKHNLFKTKELKIENMIIQKFFAEPDLNLSLIVLNNEIQKAYLLSKSIVEFINDHEKDNKIDVIGMISGIEKEYTTKIYKLYFDFLTEIVKNYFEIDMPKLYRHTSFSLSLFGSLEK